MWLRTSPTKRTKNGGLEVCGDLLHCYDETKMIDDVPSHARRNWKEQYESTFATYFYLNNYSRCLKHCIHALLYVCNVCL